MNKQIRFRRNVYIILISILAFGIISQLARSDLFLKYVSNNNELSIYQWNELNTEATNVNMLVANGEAINNKHCMVYDSTDDISVLYYANFEEVYRTLKQPYSLQDTALDDISYDACQAVIMLSSVEELGSSVNSLEQYITNGGYVFFTRMDTPGEVLSKMYRQLGIVNYWYIIGNQDIELTSNLLIGQSGNLFTDNYFYNDSLIVELDLDSELLAKGNQTPLAWRHESGAGAVMVYNGNNLLKKTHRGLIVGAISMLIPDYIYPIFNSKLFYIDDFPAPMSNSYDPKITAEYRRNISSFFKDIWWPDMIRVAKNHNLKYTAVAIEDYNEAVVAPLPTYRQEDLTNLIVYGREVLKLGGEVGIHGYNHQPLQFREDIAKEFDYVTWKSTEDMEASIQEVVAYLKTAFPKYDPISYVPPSNILSEEGRRALIDNWDSLRVISSLYEGDYNGYSYAQEFEIAEDGIIEMPRITSGYTEAADMLWLEASVMTAYGFISHFIHPDDMFDDYRSGEKGWSSLYEDFSNMLARMESTYPWLEPRTSGEAAVQVASLLHSNINRQQKEQELQVEIEHYTAPQYFILRSDKKIGKLTNCKVTLIDEQTYLVETTNKSFHIELK